MLHALNRERYHANLVREITQSVSNFERVRDIGFAIHTMSMKNLDRLGVDDDGGLYWDKKPIKMATLELTQGQEWGALVVVVATVVMAVLDLLWFFGYGAAHH